MGCRRRLPKRTLHRLVVADGAVVHDPEQTAPGRGAYLCGREGCLVRALQRDGQVLRRALRAPSAQPRLDGLPGERG